MVQLLILLLFPHRLDSFWISRFIYFSYLLFPVIYHAHRVNPVLVLHHVLLQLHLLFLMRRGLRDMSLDLLLNVSLLVASLGGNHFSNMSGILIFLLF
mmetsp:Transcript_2125/g.2019  ORF Transcript_2125/g.2019 Transcript_2125/m.2019 type:complete len:98 (+) Transcript_2125:1707-2000(+)